MKALSIATLIALVCTLGLALSPGHLFSEALTLPAQTHARAHGNPTTIIEPEFEFEALDGLDSEAVCVALDPRTGDCAHFALSGIVIAAH